MSFTQLSDDNRSVSEVMGTILILAFVLLVAVALFWVGHSVVGDASDDFSDRLGQDTMHEVDDRLRFISGSATNTGTELEIPSEVENIDAMPDEGVVNVTVTTDMTGDLSVEDIPADSESSSYNFTLGTLAYETRDGTATKYQGGMLFEHRGGDSMQILSEPGFNYDGSIIDFGFTDISDINALGAGQSRYVERNLTVESEREEEIEGMVRDHQYIGDTEQPAGFADIEIDVTIETEYVDVWEAYAENRMSEDPDISTGDDEITFGFEFQGDLTDDPGFPQDVLYAGQTDFAHLYHEETLGTVENTDDGFTISETGPGGTALFHQGGYRIAVADDGEWKIAYSEPPHQELDWYNLSDGETSAPTQLNEGDSELGTAGGVDEDEWAWDEKATICMLGGGEPPDGISKETMLASVADGTCYETVVGPDDDLPDLEPIYEISDGDPHNVNVTVGEDEINSSETIDVATGDDVEFDFSLDNIGTAKGNQFVFLLADPFSQGDQVVNFTEKPVELYPHNDTEYRNLSFSVTPGFDDEDPVVLMPQNESQALEFEFNHLNQSNLEVDITEVEDAVEGQGLNVTTEIHNSGDIPDTQQIALEVETDDEATVDAQEVTVEPGETETVNLTWGETFGLDRTDPNEVTVRSEDDSDDDSFDVAPQFFVTDVSVDPETVEDELTHDVDFEITIENIGDETNTTDLVLDSGQFDVDEEVEELEVEAGAEKTHTLTWESFNPDGAPTHYVTARTEYEAGGVELADETDGLLIVEREGPDCDEVEYDGAGSTADPYQITNIDELQCIEDQGTGENDHYTIVNDIPAQGTESWNGGDGFEPIGDQFSGQGGNGFGGTLDGQGHAIEGLTIDRFDEPFVGIFAITDEFDGGSAVGEGATIEHIVLEDIHVRGKSVVGGLVGGAGGSIEQVSVDGYVESQYQQVGGIVGHGHDADLDNELVSHATVKGTYPSDVDGEHPWGADNLGIGGIVGGTGFNTDVATAYSTANVTGNSSVGGITGWTSDFDSTNEQMYWVGGHVELDGERRLGEIGREDLETPPKAGAIAGRMELDDDNFEDSVYSDENYRSIGEQKADADDIPLAPEEMKGPQILPDDEDESFYDQFPGVTKDDAEGTMANLDWDIWEPVYDIDEEGNIINEDFPVFAWQVEGQMLVRIDEIDDPATPGEENLDVEATVENTDNEAQEQTILLTNHEGHIVDSKDVEVGGEDDEQITLTWATTEADAVNSEIPDAEFIVSGEDTRDLAETTLLPMGNLSIESVETDQPVQAINEELTVVANISAEDNVEDGSLTLRANGNLVDINESIDLNEGDYKDIEFQWTPTTVDIGTADIEVEITGQANSEEKSVTVLAPLVPFDISDFLPVDVTVDVVGE